MKYFENEEENRKARIIADLYQQGIRDKRSIINNLLQKGERGPSEEGIWDEGIIQKYLDVIKSKNPDLSDDTKPARLSAQERKDRSPGKGDFGGEVIYVSKSQLTPLAIAVFYGFSALFVISGLWSMASLWPDSDNLREGYHYTSQAYVPAIAAFLLGLFFAGFMAWMAQVLFYLQRIDRNAEETRSHRDIQE